MPPKKNKAPATIQTKLSFKPVSATKAPTLFTMETSEPLRQHMSILNRDTNNNNNNNSRTNGSNVVSKSTATITTTTSSVSSAPYTKENSFVRKTDSNDSNSSSSRVIPTKAITAMHEIGGNGVSNCNGASMSGGRTSPDTFSTKDLASSIPTSADTTAKPPSRPPSGNGEATTPDRDTEGSSEHQSTRRSSAERPLKRQADSELHGSKTSPVALDSDEDDDSNKFGARKSSQSTNRSTAISLLDQMATPRGTQPLPRSTAPLPGYETAVKKAKLSEGLSANRPILISSHSTVSDDGFASASSSLDNRLRGLEGNRGPDMSPPRFRSSIQARTATPSNVPSYSQKRSGDFTSLSKGGTGFSNSGTEGTIKSRTLPPTVSGYKPVAAVAPAYSRSSSFAKSQEWGVTRSRSSSPAAQTPTVAVRASTPTAYQNMSADKTKDGMRLSEEQRHVLEQVILYGRNVFFTGSAGTGKSVLLRELIHRLRTKYRNAKGSNYWESTSTNDAVAVTASTGIAACNIGGCTLHSFVGVGLGTEALPTLIAKVRKNSNTIRRWQDTRVLIIDEVSMVDSDFMDKVEALARSVRRNEQPWGGIQVVLTGDFFQLPPVTKNGAVKFCFEGQSWTSTITSTIQLQQVFRQKDQTFADMLDEMRLGQMSAATIRKFSQLTRALPTDDGLRPTELFPLRNQVEEANNRMLQSLPGNIMVYKARDSGPMRDKMEQNTLAPTTLQLKVNAQVMMLKNQSGGGMGGLVNGSLGVVVGFVNRPAENDNMVGSDGRSKGSFNAPGEELPLVKFTMDNGTTREMVVGREEWKIELPNGDVQGSRIQIPLGLAWSLSIHKSQGQTLPKVKVDLGKVFEKGQAYVAMSRATSLEGLQVLNFDEKRVMVHPKVTDFYSRLNVYKKK